MTDYEKILKWADDSSTSVARMVFDENGRLCKELRIYLSDIEDDYIYFGFNEDWSLGEVNY